jgi:hypothetical protein
VIVRKLSRDWIAGYAAASFDSLDAGQENLELLDTTGKLIRIGWDQVKWVCYVREIAESANGAASQPERLLRKAFSGRPRMAGLWVRLTLEDGDELEGIAANDRSLIAPTGVLLTPPDTRSNTQRVFVPRVAIRELTVLGVIGPGAPRRRRDTAQAGVASQEQPSLFETEAGDERTGG